MELEELAEKYGTDKRSAEHNYTSMYSYWFKDSKEDIKNILEIGFGNGASAKMWADFFPKAHVYVIELFGYEHINLWKSPQTSGLSNVTVISGDQTDPKIWDQIPDNLDFVVDDGSHVPDDQIISIIHGFKKLKNRGLWFVEDTHCNFQLKYNMDCKNDLYTWVYDLVVKQQIPSVSTGGDFYKYRYFLKDIVHDIYAYHFYKSVILLEKA